jgi:hypothetical protein
MRYLIFLYLLFLGVIAYAQNTTQSVTPIEECATPDLDTTAFKAQPWFDNNAYLKRTLDSLGYRQGISNEKSIEYDYVKYRIPVKFWIYRDNNGVGGPDDAELQRVMDEINRVQRESFTGIRYYMTCGASYINDSDHLEVTGLEALDLSDEIYGYFERGAVNIHIVNRYVGANGVYLSITEGIFVSRQGAAGILPFSTYAHEIGHWLGLAHTHQHIDFPTWLTPDVCIKEPIDRNRTFAGINLCFVRKGRRCESTGDALCDTPADPHLGRNGVVSATTDNPPCRYIGNQQDHYGDSYLSPPAGSLPPDPRNIMSYAVPRDCRNRFTRDQIGVMWHTINKGLRKKDDKGGWANAGVIFDVFEPNNTSGMARDIALNIRQEHNFHKVYNGKAYASNLERYTICDIDWSRFNITVAGTYTIVTSNVPTKPNANTELVLYSIHPTTRVLTEIARNDNISATNLFSRIQRNLATGQYAIQVINRANATGHYFLELSCAEGITTAFINGPISVCSTPVTYSISGLTGNPTITWSSSNNSVLTINQSTGLATRQGNFNGKVTITATVNTFCGTFTITRDISVGVGVIEGTYNYVDQTINYQYNVAPNNYITNLRPHNGPPPPMYINLSHIGALTYTWTINSRIGDAFLYASGAYAQFELYNGSSINFTCTVSTACGNTSVNFVAFRPSGSGGYYSVLASPNPSSEELSVEAVAENETQILSQTELNNINDNVKLINSFQNPVWQGKLKNGKIKFSTSNLPDGLYYLLIEREKPIVKQILIRH